MTAEQNATSSETDLDQLKAAASSLAEAESLADDTSEELYEPDELLEDDSSEELYEAEADVDALGSHIQAASDQASSFDLAMHPSPLDDSALADELAADELIAHEQADDTASELTAPDQVPQLLNEEPVAAVPAYIAHSKFQHLLEVLHVVSGSCQTAHPAPSAKKATPKSSIAVSIPGASEFFSAATSAEHC